MHYSRAEGALHHTGQNESLTTWPRAKQNGPSIPTLNMWPWSLECSLELYGRVTRLKGLCPCVCPQLNLCVELCSLKGKVSWQTISLEHHNGYLFVEATVFIFTIRAYSFDHKPKDVEKDWSPYISKSSFTHPSHLKINVPSAKSKPLCDTSSPSLSENKTRVIVERHTMMFDSTTLYLVGPKCHLE